MSVTAILLAAGSARRFGGEKLLAPYRGRPLYEHALLALASTPEVSETLMVVRPDFPLPLPPPPRVRVVVNLDHEDGMASSVRAGMRAAREETAAYLIALADMPAVGRKTISALIAAHGRTGARITVPVFEGRRGHPVIFDGALREALLSLTGDAGARGIIRNHPEWVRAFETDDAGVVFDVDEPDDLARGERGIMRERILIKGAGEQASASAHRLFRCGYRVAMTDIAQPTAIRRAVSFCSAIYEGATEVEGVRGVPHRLEDAGTLTEACLTHIPVCVDPESALVRLWRPDVIVDGRLLKHNLDNRMDDAPLVIALGPGIEAGRDVHFVVETMRGHDLGRIVASGFTSSDSGQPGEIGGYSHERVYRAPGGGTFESTRAIGDLLAAGDLIGTVAGVEVRARIPGVLRGLIRPGLDVEPGTKLADVDPRGDPALCARISDKARAVSGSVLEIVVTHAGRTTRRDS